MRTGPSCSALDVLIVEDDEDTGRMLSILLGRDGHRTVCCAEVRAASTALASRCFDLALIDLTLPDGCGVVAAEIARGQSPRPYLVAVTGWASGPVREAADLVFDEVVLKPLLLERLDELVLTARNASRTFR